MDEYVRLEFRNLCRLCISFAVSNVDIFAPNTGFTDIKTKIFDCLSIKVNEDDPFPKKICTSCLDKLESYYQYKAACTTADSTLQCYFSLFKSNITNEGFICIKSSEVGLPLQMFQDQISTGPSTNSNTCDIICEDQRFIKNKLPNKSISENSNVLLPGAGDAFLPDSFTANNKNHYDVEPPLQVLNALNATSSMVLKEPNEMINSQPLEENLTSLPINVDNDKIIILDMNKCNVLDYIDPSASIYLVSTDDKGEEGNFNKSVQLNEDTLVNNELSQEINNTDILTVNSYVPPLNQNDSFESSLNRNGLGNITNFLNFYPETNSSPKSLEETVETDTNASHNLKNTDTVEVDSSNKDSTDPNIFDEDSIDKLIRIGPQVKPAEQQSFDIMKSQINNEVTEMKGSLEKPLVIKYSKPSVPVITKNTLTPVAETDQAILPLVVKQLDVVLLSRIKTSKSYFKCQFTHCDRKFRNEERYQKHIAFHSKEKTYFCKSCKITLEDLKAFRQHSKYHKVENKEEYICKKCNKTFTRYWHLCRHSESAHSDELEGKKFKCHVCSKEFLRKASLCSHTLFCIFCEKCNKNICGQSNIKKHKELCCGEVNFEKASSNLLNEENVINVDILSKVPLPKDSGVTSNLNCNKYLKDSLMGFNVSGDESTMEYDKPLAVLEKPDDKHVLPINSKNSFEPLTSKEVVSDTVGVEASDNLVTNGPTTFINSNSCAPNLKSSLSTPVSDIQLDFNKEFNEQSNVKKTDVQLLSDKCDTQPVSLSEFNDSISKPLLPDNSTSKSQSNSMDISNLTLNVKDNKAPTSNPLLALQITKPNNCHISEELISKDIELTKNISVISTESTKEKTQNVSISTVDCSPANTKLSVDPNISDVMKDIAKNPAFRKILLSYLNKCCKRTLDNVATSSVSIQTQNDPVSSVISSDGKLLLSPNTKSLIPEKNIGSDVTTNKTLDNQLMNTGMDNLMRQSGNVVDSSITCMKVNNHVSLSDCTTSSSHSEESFDRSKEILYKFSGNCHLNSIPLSSTSKTKTNPNNISAAQKVQELYEKIDFHSYSVLGANDVSSNNEAQAQRQSTDFAFSINDNLPDTLLGIQPNFEKAYKSCIEKQFCFIEGSNTSFVDASLENIFITSEPNFDTELEDIIKEAVQTLDNCPLEAFTVVPRKDVSAVNIPLEGSDRSDESLDLSSVSASTVFKPFQENVHVIQHPVTINSTCEIGNEMCDKFNNYTTDVIHVETGKNLPVLNNDINVISKLNNSATVQPAHPMLIKQNGSVKVDKQNATNDCDIILNSSSDENINNNSIVETSSNLLENNLTMHIASEDEFNKEELEKESFPTTLEFVKNSNVLGGQENSLLNLNQRNFISSLISTKDKTVGCEGTSVSEYLFTGIETTQVESSSSFNVLELESKEKHLFENRAIQLKSPGSFEVNCEETADATLSVDDIKVSRNETALFPQIVANKPSFQGKPLNKSKYSCTAPESNLEVNLINAYKNSIIHDELVNEKKAFSGNSEKNEIIISICDYSPSNPVVRLNSTTPLSSLLPEDGNQKGDCESFNSLLENESGTLFANCGTNKDSQNVQLTLDVSTNQVINKFALIGSISNIQTESKMEDNILKESNELSESQEVAHAIGNNVPLINSKQTDNVVGDQDCYSFSEFQNKRENAYDGNSNQKSIYRKFGNNKSEYKIIDISCKESDLGEENICLENLRTTVVNYDKEAEFPASSTLKKMVKLSTKTETKSKITKEGFMETSNSPDKIKKRLNDSSDSKNADKCIKVSYNNSNNACSILATLTNEESKGTDAPDHEIRSEEEHNEIGKQDSSGEPQKVEYLLPNKCEYFKHKLQKSNIGEKNNESTLNSENDCIQLDDLKRREDYMNEKITLTPKTIEISTTMNIHRSDLHEMNTENDNFSIITANQLCEIQGNKENCQINKTMDSRFPIHLHSSEECLKEEPKYINESKEKEIGIQNIAETKTTHRKSNCSPQPLTSCNSEGSTVEKLVHVKQITKDSIVNIGYSLEYNNFTSEDKDRTNLTPSNLIMDFIKEPNHSREEETSTILKDSKGKMSLNNSTQIIPDVQTSEKNVSFNINTNKPNHSNYLDNHSFIGESTRTNLPKKFCSFESEDMHSVINKEAHGSFQLSVNHPVSNKSNHAQEEFKLKSKKDYVQAILENNDGGSPTAEVAMVAPVRIPKGTDRPCSTESSDGSSFDREERRLTIVDEIDYPDSNFKHHSKINIHGHDDLKHDDSCILPDKDSDKKVKFRVGNHLVYDKNHPSCLIVETKSTNMSSCSERWLKIKGKRRFIEDTSECSTSKKQERESVKTRVISVSTDMNDTTDEASKKYHKMNKVSPLEGYVVLCDKDNKSSLEKNKINVSPIDSNALEKIQPAKRQKLDGITLIHSQDCEDELKPKNSSGESDHINKDVPEYLTEAPDLRFGDQPAVNSKESSNMNVPKSIPCLESEKKLTSSQPVRTIHIFLEKFNRSNSISTDVKNIQKQLKSQPCSLKKRKKVETYICTKNK